MRVHAPKIRHQHLHNGAGSILAVLNKLPKTSHPLNDASKFVVDAWVLPNSVIGARLKGEEKPEALLYINVHGEFAEAPSQVSDPLIVLSPWLPYRQRVRPRLLAGPALSCRISSLYDTTRAPPPGHPTACPPARSPRSRHRRCKPRSSSRLHHSNKHRDLLRSLHPSWGRRTAAPPSEPGSRSRTQRTTACHVTAARHPIRSHLPIRRAMPPGERMGLQFGLDQLPKLESEQRYPSAGLCSACMSCLSSMQIMSSHITNCTLSLATRCT